MSDRRLDVGYASAIVGPLSVTSELGYEIYVPAPFLQALYDAARAAGEALDARLVGMYALNSLRLERASASGRANSLVTTRRPWRDLADSSTTTSRHSLDAAGPWRVPVGVVPYRRSMPFPSSLDLS